MWITWINPQKSRFLPTKPVDNHVENVDFSENDRVNIHTFYTFSVTALPHRGTVETIEIISPSVLAAYDTAQGLL